MSNAKSPYLDCFQQTGPRSIPRADFHLHTTWTDGANSVQDMYARAEELNLETVLFSEHGRKTSVDWFGAFAEEVRALDVGNCTPLVGLETKVADFDGSLDTTEAITRECDLVMASVHRFPNEIHPRGNPDNLSDEEVIETEFRLACAAASNPLVDILGHPFGMCIRRFKVIPPDSRFLALIEVAAKHQVAFEINPHYHDDLWQLIGWCQTLGAPISLGSNAHDTLTVGLVLDRLEAEVVGALH
jgi:putative hydrolase